MRTSDTLTALAPALVKAIAEIKGAPKDRKNPHFKNDYATLESVIDADMAPLFEAMRAGRLVVFPLDGVGTGLAALEHHSPTTFLHLQIRLDELQATTPKA